MKALDAAFQCIPPNPDQYSEHPQSAPAILLLSIPTWNSSSALNSRATWPPGVQVTASKPFEKLIVDLSTGRRELKSGIFLAAAIALSRRWNPFPASAWALCFRRASAAR
jgi:hypothetical protein